MPETRTAVDVSVARAIDTRPKMVTTAIAYEAHRELQNMAEGELLEVTTESHEAIENDLRAWCRMTGQWLAGVEHEADLHRYFIAKRDVAEAAPRRLALVISNPGLEELLSPLAFALAGALEGMDVAIYFQGPAVKALTKGFKAKLQGTNRPFSTFARRGLAGIGHAPAQEKLRQLAELGATFYACGPSMDHFGVAKGEFLFEGVVIAEYLSFMEVMDQADIRFFLQ